MQEEIIGYIQIVATEIDKAARVQSKFDILGEIPMFYPALANLYARNAYLPDREDYDNSGIISVFVLGCRALCNTEA